MEIRDLPLHELVLDPNLNLRDRLDQETVERYTESWGRMPPVTVFEVDGRWLLADGFHRHAAAVALGRKTISAELRHGSFDEALEFVAGANVRHGLPLTRAERRRAVEIKLRLQPDRSDRQLAEEMCVSRETIAKLRRQLVEAGQIPVLTTRVGADGKTYPALSQGLPRDPNERRPRTGPTAAEDGPANRITRANDPPWDDTTDPLPPIVEEGPPRGRANLSTPKGTGPAADRAVAEGPPVSTAAPSIEEMLGLMTRQIMDIVAWTQAEGFTEAYRQAGAGARGLFQSAVIKLAARADLLRKG